MDAETRTELKTRRVSTEERVQNLLYLIDNVRGDVGRVDRVTAWSELLEALADALQPWGELDPDFQREWEDRPMRIIRVPHSSGDPRRARIVPHPSAQDCRAAQQILTRLMARSGLYVGKRKVSGPKINALGTETALGGDSGGNVGEDTDPSLGAF